MLAGGDHSDSINSARKLARALHGELLAKHAVANITTTTHAPDGTKTTVAYQNWQATTLPDTTVKYTAYHPTGQVKATWGSQTYPTWNVYDEQGRQTQLHTWKVAPALTLASIPANPPAGSEATTWIYSATTGHLARKQYADAKGTDYTYIPGGKLSMRL